MESTTGPVSTEVVPQPSTPPNHQPEATVVVKPTTTPNGGIIHSSSPAVPADDPPEVLPSNIDAVTTGEKVMEVEENGIVSSSDALVINNQQQDVVRTEAAEVMQPTPTPTEVIRTEPTEVIMTEPTEVIRTEPTEVIMTEPTEVIRTEPTGVIRTEPAQVIMTEPTEVIRTEPTEVIMTEPTEAIMTEPTEVIRTEPTEVIRTEPTEVVMTEPTEVIRTEPTEAIMTEPTEVVQPIPTEVVPPTPTEVVRAEPTEVIRTVPTEVIRTEPTEVIRTEPTEVIRTEPTEVIRTEPTQVIRTETTEVVQPTPTEVIRAEPTEMVVQSEQPSEVITTEPTKVVPEQPEVRTQPAVVATHSVTSSRSIIDQVARTLAQQKPTEGNTVETVSLDKEVVVEESSNIVPKINKTVLNEPLINNSVQAQDPSTSEDTPLSRQGTSNDPINNEEVDEPLQIVNKPLSAMLSLSSSRKNRRKASRPMQLNRVADVMNSSQESNSQESNTSNVNIESMIHAASDITDFCDIANRFIGGDDVAMETDDSSANLTPPTHSTSSTPPEQTPSDNNQSVPVQEIAKVAIARQQNIPLTTSSVPMAKQQILRQSSSLLPIRNRQPPSLRASPGVQQQPQRQWSPVSSVQNVPKLIYRAQPVQQVIRQVPQQQQQIIQQQQQPQRFIMQQPVQGMLQGNIIQGGIIQQQPSMIMQQPQQQQQQQGAMIQQASILQQQMTAQTGIINQQMPVVQQAVHQQVMPANILAQQPPQPQQTLMVQKQGNVTPAPTGNVSTGRPGQTILVLQRGDTLKLDAQGNLVVVGKGDPPPGSTSTPTPAVQPQQQQAQPKPMNVMQHTAVQNIVQMHGQITGGQVNQPAPQQVRAPVVSVPQGTVQGQQLTSMVVQQPQVSKLHQQLTAQPQIGQSQFAIENQIAVQGRLIARGSSESKTGGGNIYFTPSTQAPFQMLASKAGQIKPKPPPSIISQAVANTSGQVTNLLVASKRDSPESARPATVTIKAITNTATKSNPVQLINDSNLAKNSSGDVTLLQCDKCKRLFVSKESLLKHLETEMHMETSQDAQDGIKKHQCSACNETFVYKSSLTLHENRLCSKQPWTAAGQSSPYNVVCGICKLRFKFKQELAVHMARIHEGQKVPVVTSPLTISTWGTMQVSDKPLQSKPPLITTIKIEPGTLPKIKSNTITTPPRKVGRPKKVQIPVPAGVPLNKAGTALAPLGQSPKRGRPPKLAPKTTSSAASAAAALVAAAAGRGKRKRRHSRHSLTDTHVGDDDDDHHGNEGDDGDAAFVVKDEKATTKYLCTKHGKYDTTNPRPHRCTLCPKGFLSQHCLLEHIKTHIKPFWCSKCGWKSSRKDNVMRHIELHHAGPKYQQKRKSPITSSKFDPAKRVKMEAEGMVDDMPVDDDLVDYHAQGDEAMDDEEKDEEKDENVNVGGDETGDKIDTDDGSRPEIESTEDKSDTQSEQPKTVLNKEGPHEPDKQPSPDEGSTNVNLDKVDAVAAVDVATVTPSVPKPSLEESMVSSTTNHFLGFSSQTGSQKLQTNTERAIQQPEINTRACLGGINNINQGLTSINNISNIKDVGDGVHSNDDAGDVNKNTNITKSVIQSNADHEVAVETVLSEMITAIATSDKEQCIEEQYFRKTREEILPAVDKDVLPVALPNKEIEMDVDCDQSTSQTKETDIQEISKGVEVVDSSIIEDASPVDDKQTKSQPPYADLLGNLDECIAYLIDEMITSIEESEEEEDDFSDDVDEMEYASYQDVESIDDDDDDVIGLEDDDVVMSGVEEIEDSSNHETEVTDNQVGEKSTPVISSDTVGAEKNAEVVEDISNQVGSAVEQEAAQNNQNCQDDEVTEMETTASEAEELPVVFQLAPDQGDSNQSQIMDTTAAVPQPASEVIDDNLHNEANEQATKEVHDHKVVASGPVQRGVTEEVEEVMIIEGADKPKVPDVIDVASDDEQQIEQSISKLPNRLSDLPSPPPLISSTQPSILGQNVLTKRGSGILDKVLERLEPKTEPSNDEQANAEADALKQLEQDATRVIENAEKELLQQRLSEAGAEVVDMNNSSEITSNKEQLPVIASVTSLSDMQKPGSSSFAPPLGHSVANIMGGGNDARMARPQPMIPGQMQPFPMPPGYDPRYIHQPDGSYTIQWGSDSDGTDPRLARPPVSLQPTMGPPGMHPIYDPRYMTPQQVAMMRQVSNIPPHMHPGLVRNPTHMSTFVDPAPRMPQFQGMLRQNGAEIVSVPSSPTLIQGVQAPMIPGNSVTPPTPVSVGEMGAIDIAPRMNVFNNGAEQVVQMQPNGIPAGRPQPNQVGNFIRPNEQLSSTAPPNVTVSSTPGNSQLKRMLSSGIPDTNANYASMKAATASVSATTFQPASQMNGDITQVKEPAFSPTTPVSTEQSGMPHRRHSSGSSRSKNRRDKAISPEDRRKSVSTTNSNDPDFDITERPYICHICGKGFKRRNNLCDHVRIHSRPYKCGECNFGTTRWQYLAEHMRKTHGFEADDKEFEKLFKDSGKKLKPTDYIPESSLMPVIANVSPTISTTTNDETPSGANLWTNAGNFNRRESLTANDSDLVDFYGQVESTFASPKPAVPKPVKKPNMRRAAVAAENLINKVTNEDKETDNVLIQPIILPKPKKPTNEADWQAFIKESESETSETSDLRAEAASETTESQQDDMQSQATGVDTDVDASSIAPSVDAPSMSSVDEQFHHHVDTDEEEGSIMTSSSHAIKEEQLTDEEPMETETAVQQELENHVGEDVVPPEVDDTRDTEFSASNDAQSESIADDRAEEDASVNNEDEDSMNNNEQDQVNGEPLLTASGRPRRRSASFRIENDIRDLLDEDYTPYSNKKKSSALVMKINLKEMSVRGGGRGRPRGRGRGRGVGRGRGGGGGGAPGGGADAPGKAGRLPGRGRHENRVNMQPEGDVPIKTNAEGGIDLIQYYSITDDMARPFKCAVNDCVKQFKSKQHMREHLFTHLRPYKCDICGTGFARTDYLAMHMKDDHNVKATKEQLYEKRKLANARAMVCRSRPSKDHKRQELYEILHSP